ncbi:MAG: AAA family ATPase [Micavibrio sp.]|nr:AAA family ATPase [Micavibrio sp.]
MQIYKKDKKRNVILVIGAYGVGKTTICKHIAEKYINLSDKKKQYIHIDLDGYIGKLHKMEVKDYFGKVGYEKFYDESYKIICRLYKNHAKKKINKTLLIDVGSGSSFDYKSIALTKEFNALLLTADPEYLYDREKCKTSNKELGYYKFWQFGNEKKHLYSQCSIKIDVSFLTVEQIADIVDNKIKSFQNGHYF